LKVVASVEARMGSSRLPGKVLHKIGPQTALERLFGRLKACRRLDGLILATSTSSQDDVLEAFALEKGIPCFRGSENDVLARVVEAHEKMRSDIIIEVTGDCPLLDPDLIELGIETFLQNDCDVVTNCRIPSFPQGVDVQIFCLTQLRKVRDSVADPAVREHVSLHFYEHPEQYRIIHLLAPLGLRDPDLRLQMDYPEDLELIQAIYERLEPIHGPCFGLAPVLDLLHREPGLRRLNAQCQEKPVRQK
jgi:spore coat polysaccharide biosynthesis protein SpsF